MAATELAVTLPLLALLVCACADLGRAMHYSVAVSNAALAGAEAGCTRRRTELTEESWEADVRQSIEDELAGVTHFDPSLLDVDISVLEGGELLRVTIEVTYQFSTLVSWPGLPNVVDVRGRTTMRQFR